MWESQAWFHAGVTRSAAGEGEVAILSRYLPTYNTPRPPPPTKLRPRRLVLNHRLSIFSPPAIHQLQAQFWRHKPILATEFQTLHHLCGFSRCFSSSFPLNFQAARLNGATLLATSDQVNSHKTNGQTLSQPSPAGALQPVSPCFQVPAQFPAPAGGDNGRQL